MKLYQFLAQQIGRLHNLRENALGTYHIQAAYDVQAQIEEFVKERFPRGSGFDAGTTLDLDAENPNRLVFTTSFHHMDEHGGYDGWTEHTVVVTPDLQFGYNIRVTGRNRNDIKDYIGEQFHYILGCDEDFKFVMPDAPTVSATELVAVFREAAGI